MRRILGSAVLLLVLAGCMSQEEAEKRGRGDAPVEGIDDSAAEAVNFPDLFSNMATKCNHGNRLYSTTDGYVVVVAGDPSCAEGAEGEGTVGMGKVVPGAGPTPRPEETAG